MKPKMMIVTTIPLSLMFFKGQIGVLKNAFDVSVVSSPGKRLDAIVETEEVLAHAVPMQREISFFKDVVSLIQLIKLFRKEKPELVHGNTPKGGLLSMIAAYLVKVPNRVYYLHGLRYQGAAGFKRKLLMKMEQLSCRLATDVFAVSKEVRANLIKDGIYKKPITLIWNGSISGVNTDYFDRQKIDVSDLRTSLKLTEEYLVFGFVGRLVGDKGVNELVTAFESINESYSNTRLLLVGPFESDLDPLLPDTEQKIKDNPAILSVGFQRDIRSYLALMDVFSFPSYREGLAVSLLEAQAMELAIVCCDVTGCSELIVEGVNGLLIPPRSTKVLQNTMMKLLKDESLRQKMSKEARVFVTNNYEQHELWDKSLTAYKKIVKHV